MPSRRIQYYRPNHAGFTLIELMIVVAIIGILASIAVSAYQTFVVRAQISEGLNLAAGAKVPIVEAYINTGTAPADRIAAGMSPSAEDTSGNYVSAVAITNGRIDITFGGARAHQAIFNQTLYVTPYETSGNTVVWRCGNADPPADERLEGGEDHLPPTFDVRYLPSTCR